MLDRKRRLGWILIFGAATLAACSCGSISSTARGDTANERRLAGGDMVTFMISPAVYQQPGHERLFLLTTPQPVGVDGTIEIPYVGAVPVLGLTETALTQAIKDVLRPVFHESIELQPRIRPPRG